MILTCPHCESPTFVASGDAAARCEVCREEVFVQKVPQETIGWFSSPQSWESLARLLIVGAVVAIIAILLIPTHRMPTPGAGYYPRMEAGNQLKRIGLALAEYETRHGHWLSTYSASPTGKPLLSWRVHLLPQLGHQTLYDQFHFDEPWDTPHNRTLISRMPVDLYGYPMHQPLRRGETCILAYVGPRSIFQPPLAGQGKLLSEVTPSMITDDRAQVLVTIEVDPSAAVIWTKPDDFDFDLSTRSLAKTRGRGGVYEAGFADIHIESIPVTLPPRDLRAIGTRDGGERPVEFWKK